MNASERNDNRIEEREMIQYWLGELSPEAEQRLEERYFADDELFEQMLGVREELIDAFVRGELTLAQRAHFEQRLLQSPSDRAQLEFAQGFIGALDGEIAAANRAGVSAPEPAASRSWWSFPRLAWAVACAALLVGVGWLINDNIRLRRQLSHLQSEQGAERQRTRELEAQLAQIRSANAVTQPTPQPAAAPSPNPSPPSPVAPREKESLPANTMAVTLSAVSLRGAGGETVQLTPETRTLRFKLLLDAPDAFRHYQVVLTQSGRDIRSWRRLKPARSGGVAVVVDLPATQLSSGEYSFELRGVNDDGTIESAGRYSFRIVKP